MRPLLTAEEAQQLIENLYESFCQKADEVNEVKGKSRVQPIIDHVKQNPRYWKDSPEGLRSLLRALELEYSSSIEEFRKTLVEPLVSCLRNIEAKYQGQKWNHQDMEMEDFIVQCEPILTIYIRSSLFDALGNPLHDNISAFEKHSNRLAAYDREHQIFVIVSQVGHLKIKIESGE